jgi:hypothetical protein
MAVKRYNGTAWDTVAGLGAQGAAATSSSITTWVKTASGGETSLTGSSDSSTTLAYTAGQEQLFINGVLQVRGSDYTATNGTSITGLTALTAGDIATVTTVNAFSVTGAVPLSTVTANGDLIVGTSSGAVGRLGIGSTGNLLTVSGGVPTWAAAPSTDKTWTSIANGNIATGVSTTTITGLSGYDDIIILLYNRVTSADNKTYELTMNNTTTYFGSYFRSDAYGTGNDSAGTGSGFRLNSVNYAGTANSNDYIHIRGCKSTGMKTFEYIYASGYMTQHYIVEGYTNSTAALSSFTITSNGTLNGGTYRILGA